MASTWRPRVGLVTARFTLFDPQMPAEFPARMRAHASRSAEILARFADVVALPLIESVADAEAVAANLAGQRLDAVVFAPAMAAPPSFADVALASVGVPLVLWNAPSVEHLPDDLRQDEATVHSTSVGTLMFANVLVRRGRSFEVVTAGHEDQPALRVLERIVRAVAVAGSLRGAAFLRVGDPIPGYLDVEVDDRDLDRLGVREVALTRDDWERRVATVDLGDAAALVERLRERWAGDPGPSARESAAIALALGRALDECGAVGGSVNCHGPWFRTSGVVGLPACLAVACETANGRPFACTGDIPTAIALLLARRLTGAALYCECYVPERASGLVLVAAGGEGDPAWSAPPDAVSLEANDHYPGERGQGSSVAFALREGPATILSLSPARDGWTLAWAPGEVVESRYANMRGPNGMFRFDSGQGEDAISRWIRSGATHHNAMAPGRLDLEVPVLAAALGIDHQRV